MDENDNMAEDMLTGHIILNNQTIAAAKSDIEKALSDARNGKWIHSTGLLGEILNSLEIQYTTEKN